MDEIEQIFREVQDRDYDSFLDITYMIEVNH